MPVYSQGATGINGSIVQSGAPLVNWYIDHDDANLEPPTIGGIDDMRQRHNYKRARSFRPIKIVIKPRAQVVLQNREPPGNTALDTQAMMVRPRRLDMSYPQIPHFGLKMIFNGLVTSNAATYSYKAETTYYIKLMGVR